MNHSRPGPAPAGLVDAFRELTLEGRRDLLEQLVTTALSLDECYSLLDLITQRRHRDIFGDLPLELAVLIAGYLEPSETFLARRVSKKWHALLSSPLICSTSCRNFVSHRVLDTNAPDWEADYLRYAKRRLNVITGRPVSKARYICEYTIENTENKFHYSDGMLAWCLDVTTIRLLSLQTGHSERARSFAFNKRQPIVCVRVSSSIVAVLTSHGYCQSWDYKSGEENTLRLPSASYIRKVDVFFEDSFVVDNYTVAICLAGGHIIVWDTQNKISREIKINRDPFQLFLDAERKQLAVILEELTKNRDIRESHNPNSDSLVSGFSGMIYSTDNRDLDPQQSLSLPLPGPMHSYLLHGVCDLGTVNGRVFEFARHGEFPSFVACLTYDKRLARPVIRYYPDVPRHISAELYTGTLLPNEVVYVYSAEFYPNPFVVIDLRGKCKPAEIFKIQLETGEEEFESELPGVYWFGDDLFYGVISDNTIHVWCFDDDQHLDGEVRGYRDIRNELAVGRRKSRGSAEKLAARE